MKCIIIQNMFQFGFVEMQVIDDLGSFLKAIDVGKLYGFAVPIVVRVINGDVRFIQELDIEIMACQFACRGGNSNSINHLIMLQQCPANMSVLYVIANGKSEYYAFSFPKLPSKL